MTPALTEAELAASVHAWLGAAGRRTCPTCADEPVRGWIEIDDNGPIVRCPTCGDRDPEPHEGDPTMSDVTTTRPAPAEAVDPILDIPGATAELRRQGLNWTERQVRRQAVEFRDREDGLPFKKLPNGHLAIRRSALLKAIEL